MSKLLFDTKPHANLLTKDPSQSAVLQTYIGMAHVAGTGPDGVSCRECWFFGIERRDKAGNLIPRHSFYSANRKDEKAGLLKKHYCLRPVLNKAKRLFPHTAPSCSLFERNESPPAPKRPTP